jgi:hypothetical protein
MDISAIALQGVAQAQVQLDAAANNLVRAGTASPNGADLNVANFSAGIVALNSAQTLLKTSLSTLKTADQLQKNVLDLLA